jgi:hypothetical protein
MLKILSPIFLAAICMLLCAAPAARAVVYTGFNGQYVQGILDPTSYPVTSVQNASNLTPPQALVGSGEEFTADFTDIFHNQWHLSMDLQDDYQMILRTSSPNPSANIGGPVMVQWHLYGLGFEIADLQFVSGPLDDRSVPSFDANNIWVGFNTLAAYSPYDSYTFQIVPVPEPSAAALLGLGAAVWLLRRRDKSRGNL